MFSETLTSVDKSALLQNPEGYNYYPYFREKFLSHETVTIFYPSRNLYLMHGVTTFKTVCLSLSCNWYYFEFSFRLNFRF